MASKTGKKHQIGNWAVVILTILAAVADLFSLIPFVGDFVGPIFWIFASIYFWKSGMGFVNVKRLATSSVSLAAELIPAIQALPTIVVGIVVIIVITRFEDKTGIKLPALGTASARTPLNVGEVRMPTPQTGTGHIAPAPLNQSGVRASVNTQPQTSTGTSNYPASDSGKSNTTSTGTSGGNSGGGTPSANSGGSSGGGVGSSGGGGK